MMGHSLLQSLPICRLLLRSASLLVPGRTRADWLAEWEAELWHVLRSHVEGRDRAADEVACTLQPHDLLPRRVSGCVVASPK